MAISPPSLAIKGFYYKTEVTPTSDGGLNTVTLKSSTPSGTFAPVTSTIIDKTGKAGDPSFDFPGASDADRAAFSNPTSEESKSRNTQVGSTKPFGNNPTAEQQKVLNSAKGTPNAATNSPTPPGQGGTQPTPEQSAAVAAESVTTKDGTRKKYNLDMRYPENLSLVQDVIKFSILEYSPSLAKKNQTQGEGQFGSTKSRVVTLEGDIPVIVGSERIGMITLPIPAGISDSNTAGWQSGDLSMLQEATADFAKGLFEGGVGGATQSAERTTGNLQGATASGDLQTAVKSIFLDNLTQANVTSRAFGAVLNNNTELLFSGPGLRSFSFIFFFYPRRKEEAIIVKQIIRAFKQAMSVKRSATSLLLKAPHTFAIQYLTSKDGKAVAHPYLNRFKECALTSCNVDYTPDGTYMTYDGDEKSMTAYRLSLSFQELEPLFDDEYGSDDDNVGF
jgi:hypothetical protein